MTEIPSAISLSTREIIRLLICQHYEEIDGRDRCIYCNESVRARAGDIMKKHLLNCYRAKSCKIDITKSCNLEIKSHEDQVLSFSSKLADEDLKKLMFICGLPFSLLDCPEFIQFCKRLNGAYKPFSRYKFTNTILYDELALVECQLMVNEEKGIHLRINGNSS